MTYNGYTNYATWNVNLWVGGVEHLYKSKVHYLKVFSNSAKALHPLARINGEFVETFVTTHMGGTTPDNPDMDTVNWEELADHWEEERQEMLRLEADNDN